jgi:hypothetical protein
MTCVIDIRAGRTRRQLFRDLGLFAGAAGVMGILAASPKAAAGPSKLDPKAVSYQPTPKGAARCDNCIQWQAPNACKVVNGVINPAGWCSIYMRKS